MKQIVLASGNKGKLKEFAEMFNAFNIEVLPQNQFDVPEVAETGTTFVENAIIKARHAAEITGLPLLPMTQASKLMLWTALPASTPPVTVAPTPRPKATTTSCLAP